MKGVPGKLFIDAHAHILPAADHGCDGTQTASEQLRLAAAAGVTHIIATSHFYPQRDTAEAFLARRKSALEAIAEIRKGIEGAPLVIPAAEVYMTTELYETDILPLFCVGGSRVILIELSSGYINDCVYRALTDIRDRKGLTPVIAHVDRYADTTVRRLSELYFPMQLNSTALRFPHTSRWRPYIQSGQITALGSDIHGAARNSYRSLRAAAATVEKLSPGFMRRSAVFFGI